MLSTSKSRLVLLSQLMASCVTLAACGGGLGSSDSTASADMVSISDPGTSSRTEVMATDSTTATAASVTAMSNAAPAPVATADAATTATAAPAPAATAVAAPAPATAAVVATTDTTATADAQALAFRRRNSGTNTARTTAAATPVAAPAATPVAAPAASPAPAAVAVPVAAPVAAPAPAPASTATVVTSGPQTTVTFAATTLNMPNPDRGFYGWGADYLQNYTQANLTNLRDTQGLRLVLGLIDLSAYRSSNMPQSFLDALTAKFAMLRSTGIKVVLRPVYNYDSSGSDASLAQVKAHLAQLAPLFAANADVIGFVQAGFIGAWGEWHDSASGLTSDANKAAIRDAVLAAVPSQFPVQFRYPYDIIKWFPTALSAGHAFDGSTQSRSSVHNDCFMSSDNDVGTYQNNSLTNNSERDYTKAITEYGPFGGETCSGFTNPRKTCAAILSEGPAYHLAYLNINFDASFIAQWKAEGCYDQVARSIGYRLQLDQLAHPTTASRNTTVAFNVDLHNVGWSRMFSPRKLVVTLKNKSTGAIITATGATDMRTLPSQASAATRAAVQVTIPSDAATGDYAVSVSLPDNYSSTASDVRYSVRFANADNIATAQAWNATTGKFDVGTTITVQ